MNAVRLKCGDFVIIGVAAETDKAIINPFRPYPTELEATLVSRKGSHYFIQPIRQKMKFD